MSGPATMRCSRCRSVCRTRPSKLCVRCLGIRANGELVIRTPGKPLKGKRCPACHIRRPQWPSKLCRRCEKLSGDYLTGTERDAAIVARQQRKRGETAPLPPMVAVEAPERPPNRVIEVDGQSFEVVWNGLTPLVFG